MTEISKISRPLGIPWCEKCGRKVWSFTVDMPHEEFAPEMGHYLAWRHTGEIVVTIKCHGETWIMSNWHGPLDFWESF